MPKRELTRAELSSTSSDSSDSEEPAKAVKVQPKKKPKSTFSKKSSPKKQKTSDDRDEKLSLSRFKLVGISTFKSKVYVDIRKYYEDGNGEMKPTKQGISLTVDELNALKDNMGKIDTKLNSSDDGDEKMSLSRFKLVGISTFKSKDYVNIRKYYEDGSGEMKPTKQGVALTAAEWNALKDNMDNIDAKLNCS